MQREDAYRALGYINFSNLEEGWRAAQSYNAFDAEHFNKRILSSLNAIDIDLTPPENVYVCPFCGQLSFRPRRQENDMVLTCSACGSSVTLNAEVWGDPRKRIECLSFTSGYPGTYILHHFIALHGGAPSRADLLAAEDPWIEKAVCGLSSPDEEIRYRAARYLRLRRSPQAFEPAAAALASEKAVRVRLLLVQALPSLGGSDAVPSLISAAGDVDPAVRSAALRALSTFEGADVGDVIERAAGDDPDADVRRLATRLTAERR